MKKRLVLLTLAAALSMSVCVSRPERVNATQHLDAPHHLYAGIVQRTLEIMTETTQQLDREEKLSQYKKWEIDMLCGVVQAEAGNQDGTGKRLVCDVILNRVSSEIFPDSIYGVLTQKNQFSTMSDGAYEKWVYHVSDSTRAAVIGELTCTQRMDSKILYFTAGKYNDYCTPAYKHGDHYFGY